ncbi:hypothetical protein P4O66_008579 [Electrophorus voltai]|uniref:Uncharacterized protein n=1 Tax=Electrophorus voltai TaxID=2609070 RepID=A0AAD9DVQ2_9TELE|nr:hypothetical protein P4O66_008579 [Electrophorus voltai]
MESILTGNITVWFWNSTKQDRQALQRVVRSAERITHAELPDLQIIYYKQCQTKARRIMKDPTHPNNRLFSLLSKQLANMGKIWLANMRVAPDEKPYGPTEEGHLVGCGKFCCRETVSREEAPSRAMMESSMCRTPEQPSEAAVCSLPGVLQSRSSRQWVDIKTCCSRHLDYMRVLSSSPFVTWTIVSQVRHVCAHAHGWAEGTCTEVNGEMQSRKNGKGLQAESAVGGCGRRGGGGLHPQCMRREHRATEGGGKLRIIYVAPPVGLLSRPVGVGATLACCGESWLELVLHQCSSRLTELSKEQEVERSGSHSREGISAFWVTRPSFAVLVMAVPDVRLITKPLSM